MKQIEFDKTHETKYCIPLWLRDEQMKIALKRVKARVKPVEDHIDDPIAVVCYGSSLKTTWKKAAEFKRLITCSGAHKFLLDKGVSPRGKTWYHVEVDPRSHKVHLLGKPRKAIQYLVSSTCHKAYLDVLDGYNVKLWNVLDKDSIRLLPQGEWALTGGANVGLRAMVLARFLGYRNMHVFGMDGSKGKTGLHAGEHPNQPEDFSVTEFNGEQFLVTPSLLECAKAVTHEMDMLPDVTAKFYGKGLVQEIMKGYKRKDRKDAYLGIEKPVLISEEYKSLNRQFHVDRPDYGVGGGKYAKIVQDLCESLKTTSVLDYGCGKGYLAKAIPFPIWEYDPGIPGKDDPPRPADILVCTDVLEHIEPDKLGPVLEDIGKLIRKVGYLVIHTGPAGKNLPDGRNAHLIQKPLEWWKPVLEAHFKVGKLIETAPLIHAMVSPK